ncbi:MAG: NADH-quinone oxidoreductase subunit L, partial [Deltaproteobacteria bacterium]|nr:NADH-quinone oxidoreductase subunit L [Deltaproteobacteria bacterium]
MSALGIVLLIMILLPLCGSILNGLVLRPVSAGRAGGIASFFSASSFVAAVVLWLCVLSQNSSISVSLPWFATENLNIRWEFVFDHLTAVMALVVTGIGTLIHLYSIGYMSEDATPSRYFAYLNLFLFSMLTLISGANLVVLFVGWEGVGFCSYALIGYWYEDIAKSNAGMKAFLVNRIGDAGFLLGIFLCWVLFKTTHCEAIKTVLSSSASFDPRLINLVGILLFIGAMGKSAQIPLYVWLPDAMAGPTPVSALIHAATMVTAGVYMVARMGFLYEAAHTASLLVATIGVLTALFAATIAVAQRDIKKVLAYSTVSQLGFMFLALGTHNYVAAIFHLMTHAFFKALLFLGAGSVIHALSGEQDIFEMGGLRKKLPFTFWTFTVATIAICGLPPFAGFFSKDTILYSALLLEQNGRLFWTLGLITSGLTAFYMTRLVCLVFFGNYRGKAHPHESPFIMTGPLIVLAIGSALAGFLGVPHDLHLLPNYLEHFLEHSVPIIPIAGEHPLSEMAAMLVAIAVAVVGVAGAMIVYGQGPKKAETLAAALGPIHKLLANKYWVD